MIKLSGGSTRARVDASVLPREGAVALQLGYYDEIASKDRKSCSHDQR